MNFEITGKLWVDSLCRRVGKRKGKNQKPNFQTRKD